MQWALRIVWVLIAAGAVAFVDGKPSYAQETCGAKTCSQARAGCMRRCHGSNSSNCVQHCGSQYSNCMETGVFIGKFCGHKEGLKKQ